MWEMVNEKANTTTPRRQAHYTYHMDQITLSLSYHHRLYNNIIIIVANFVLICRKIPPDYLFFML